MTAPVHDPHGASRDPKMRFLREALDPDQAERHLGRILDGARRVRAIRVVRYKPGMRCLVEYDLSWDDGSEALTVLGKARAGGVDAGTYRICEALRRAGFSEARGSGVAIPEPLGLVPEFHMWFQRKVPGELAGALLPRPEGVHLARRIADALHKLQSSGVASTRVHALQDELDILHQRLASVAESRPDWAPRIGAILDVCDRLGSAIPDGEPRRVHRDFYQDQVIVGEDGRLYLLDLDLYAEGDPAVDAGNFLAHLTEWGLRALGDPDAMADRQAAFERRFVERTGGRTGPAVQAYAFLSLVRHVSISVQIPERRPFTEQILRLCERRQPDVRVLSAQPALAL